MTLRLYNTMTRRVDDFAPLTPPTVTLYTCGPTVYNYATSATCERTSSRTSSSGPSPGRATT